ncbi:MAG TPA: hypothetical protein H9894_06720 [Candidatus Desulfovibrio intestinipullorum]|uniref:Uncharacterized protein n=1 Tax=Candidatus Desulfovibrio intestinipullorum TaxID=2838536 RepID=A0A9D1PXI1_9BACT|nr:hypothetical protein [Candidatus Desulfovibrio intestinipullorum]
MPKYMGMLLSLVNQGLLVESDFFPAAKKKAAGCVRSLRPVELTFARTSAKLPTTGSSKVHKIEPAAAGFICEGRGGGEAEHEDVPCCFPGQENCAGEKFDGIDVRLTGLFCQERRHNFFVCQHVILVTACNMSE